jgi:hypothetical protein
MNQQWLSGFTDAEGCFCLSYRKDKEKYAPMFVIKQHAVDSNLIFGIKNFFCVGRIYTSANLCSFMSNPSLN